MSVVHTPTGAFAQLWLTSRAVAAVSLALSPALLMHLARPYSTCAATLRADCGAVAPEPAALAASTRIAAVQIIGPSNCAGRCHDAAPRRHVEYLCAWHATSGAAETHESSRAHNSTARWCGAAAAEQARNARFSSCASHLVRASQLAHTSHLVRLTSASHQSKRRSTACCVPKAWMPARRGSGADSRIGW